MYYLIKFNKVYLKKVLILIIILLYLTFLYLDIFDRKIFIPSNIIKFLSIFLCFSLAILNINPNHNKLNSGLLITGLFFTVIADYIFLICKNYFPLAIGLFSIVQVLYMIRYNYNNKDKNTFYLILSFIIIFSIYFTINIFIKEIKIIFPLGLFYAISLIISLKEGYIQYKYNLYPSPNKDFILLGMILFLLCDINVAIYNTIGKMNLIVFILIWIFYLPSQLLLALS